MNLFDILGPVMVGPSSSHTAGAVRIGLMGRKLLGQQPTNAEILLHGSFADTGTGHGTDRALVAGLLGLEPDDSRIPDSFSLAKERGMAFTISPVSLRDAHPNTAVLRLQGENCPGVELQASSVGGGRIQVDRLDGISVKFSGESNTLIIHNQDKRGLVSEVSSVLSFCGINIATLQLFRDKRGGTAVMMIEIDHSLPAEALRLLEKLDGVMKVTYLQVKE